MLLFLIIVSMIGKTEHNTQHLLITKKDKCVCECAHLCVCVCTHIYRSNN